MTRKIEPKNPDEAKAAKADDDKGTERKTQTIRNGRRKMGRKTGYARH